MTPAELRHLAAQKLAAADSLAADADRLRSQAAAVRGLLDPLVSMSQRVWAGPAAADFETKVRAHAQQLDGESLRLRQIAGEFDGEARSLHYEAAALRRAADAAELAAAIPVGAS
ncbi:MAG: hypothetical protein U9N84_01580 [Actinomycetota bacterium]|nr:hypothetical protein [Actinomycetota bacterium]